MVNPFFCISWFPAWDRFPLLVHLKTSPLKLDMQLTVPPATLLLPGAGVLSLLMNTGYSPIGGQRKPRLFAHLLVCECLAIFSPGHGIWFLVSY